MGCAKQDWSDATIKNVRCTICGVSVNAITYCPKCGKNPMETISIVSSHIARLEAALREIEQRGKRRISAEASEYMRGLIDGSAECSEIARKALEETIARHNNPDRLPSATVRHMPS